MTFCCIVRSDISNFYVYIIFYNWRKQIAVRNYSKITVGERIPQNTLWSLQTPSLSYQRNVITMKFPASHSPPSSQKWKLRMLWRKRLWLRQNPGNSPKWEIKDTTAENLEKKFILHQQIPCMAIWRQSAWAQVYHSRNILDCRCNSGTYENEAEAKQYRSTS